MTDALSITVGDRYACAIRRAGTVACWGRNPNGNLGDTTTSTRTTPVDVPGFDRVNLVAAQRLSTCALRNGGDLWCWGSGTQGGLALGGNNDYWSPRATNFPSKFRTLSGNLYKTYMCGALLDGTVRCWGINNYGQRNVPADLSGVVAISAGGFHTCALNSSGAVRCWGYNHSGQTNVPTDAQSGVSAVSAGSQHMCALLSGGAVSCWGGNFWGQAEVPADALSGVSSVSAGDIHTCAIRSGAVRCWGANRNG
jgi:alpha-tubulin suppressor-like RCC1 family protein